MKLTAYERARDFLAPTMDRARRVVEQHPDPAELLKRLFTEAVSTGMLEHNGLLATVPYVLAEKATKMVPDPFVWEEYGLSEPIQTLANFDLALGEMVHRQDPLLNQSWVTASVLNLWQYQCHRMAGERVYELSVGLGERLLHTELHGLATDDLRLPYRSIYIVVPAELGLTLENERTGTHALEGVYVTEYEHGGLRKWKLLFWGPPNERSQHEHDDTLFHFGVDLAPGKSLDEALDESELFRRKDTTPGTDVSRKYYLDQWRRLFTLVMNTVVYCTWPDAELRQVQNNEFTKLQEQMKKHPKGSHKYERTREKLRGTPQQRRILLGPTVAPLGTLNCCGEKTGLAPHGPLSVRTLVSGHWKRQPYGEGRALRKWIFIEPFWRGPEASPESNPRRVLEGA